MSFEFLFECGKVSLIFGGRLFPAVRASDREYSSTELSPSSLRQRLVLSTTGDDVLLCHYHEM